MRTLNWVLICLFVVALTGCGEAGRAFAELRRERRDESGKANEIARKLMSTPEGVALAARDCDLFGGKTRGWSSWILEESALGDAVRGHLSRIKDDGALPLAKRFEATWIMWIRSRCEDDALLRLLIEQASNPGGPDTALARRKLCTAINLDKEDLRRSLAVKPTSALAISFDEVKGGLAPFDRWRRNEGPD